eukprot:321316_1
MALLEEDLHLAKGELDEDCALMMNTFYSNLWDWFFISRDFWTSLPYYNAFEIVRIRVQDINWTMRTDQVMALLEEDLHLAKGELDEDCALMMNTFYSNLWDWFFISRDFWTSLPYYNAFEIVRIRVQDINWTMR